MLRQSFLVFLVLFVLSGAVLAYDSKDCDFFLQPPQAWGLNDEGMFGTVVSLVPKVEKIPLFSVMITMERKDPAGVALQEYVARKVEKLSSDSRNTLSKPAQRNFGGIPAIEYTYAKDPSDAKRSKGWVIVCFNKGKAYTLTYFADASFYERYLGDFEGLLRSFAWRAGSPK